MAFLVIVFAVIATARPIDAQSSLKSRVYATGLSAPVAFVQDPTSSSRQFVVEQGGRIRVIQSGVVQATDFLDLRGVSTPGGGERGLLGMAVAPNYATSGRFYVNFTDLAGNTVIARFLRSSDPAVADSSSRFDLQWPSGLKYILQPYANHNSGNLAFGPDGYLYIAMGDGGSGNDPENRAQNPAELLGKMLRIDVSVSNATGYVVPSTNPFVSGGPTGVLKEIWSFGLRNPWRYSFDMPSRGGTGALIIGDVGQGAWEEIDYEPAGRSGRNYGWRVREGAHDNITDPAPVYIPPTGLTNPIWEVQPLGRTVNYGRVRVSRLRASRIPRSVLLCRLRAGSRVVHGTDHQPLDR